MADFTGKQAKAETENQPKAIILVKKILTARLNSKHVTFVAHFELHELSGYLDVQGKKIQKCLWFIAHEKDKHFTCKKCSMVSTSPCFWNSKFTTIICSNLLVYYVLLGFFYF